MAPCYLVNNSHTLTKRKKLQTTDLSFRQRVRLIVTKLQESRKTKKSGHEFVKKLDTATYRLRKGTFWHDCAVFQRWRRPL